VSAHSTRRFDRTAPVLHGSVPRYLGVGILSYAVDLGLLALCYSVFGLPLWLATSVGFWTSFLVNFGLNRSVTFRSRGRKLPQLVKYSLLVSLNYLASIGLVSLAEAIGAGYAVGKTVSVGILVVVNYLAYRYWVFNTRSDP
jgi:putative flippase GtrA